MTFQQNQQKQQRRIANPYAAMSIDNMFNSNIVKTIDAGIFNVETLYNNIDSKKPKFDPAQLLDGKNLKKEKIEKCYEHICDVCCTNIKRLNDGGHTLIYYQIPLGDILCPGYDQMDCIKYLKNHLDKLNFDTKIMSRTKIRIDWTNLEENIARRKQADMAAATKGDSIVKSIFGK